MTADVDPRRRQADRQWFIIGRWQEFEGEGRANLLRVIAIGAFYVVELINFYGLKSVDKDVHDRFTFISVAWVLLALAVLLCLRRLILPVILKYISTSADILLLTTLAAVGRGPASSLVFVYFLIIALAALRFNLPLVRYATIGCMLGYIALLGNADSSWFDAEHVVPVAEELIMLVSLALTGIVIGQVIRRVRALAGAYAKRMDAIGERQS